MLEKLREVEESVTEYQEEIRSMQENTYTQKQQVAELTGQVRGRGSNGS